MSDPGSRTSHRESSTLFEHNPQLIDNEILTRVQKLENKIEEYEQKNVEYEQKIEQLETHRMKLEETVKNLEASNALLRSSLDDERKQFEQPLEATKMALENQIETAMQAIRNISGGGQAPPGPSSSALEPRAESLSEKVDELQAQLDDVQSTDQPQVTPLKYWKNKACAIIGTNVQGDTHPLDHLDVLMMIVIGKIRFVH